MSGKGNIVEDEHIPSRIYTPAEVPIPGFLFDHPDVRLELAHYYSSVRRADDCLGNIIKALQDTGKQNDTVIIFLSDHGMPLPFAKTAVWHHSTRTPLIIVWPGVTKPGSVDKQHMVSGVDLLPTLLDIAGLPHPKEFDGASFLPTVKGERQKDRDFVYKFHNENSGRNRSPMRSVQSKRFGYIFNPWSDGKRVFKTATRGTATFRAMQKLAPKNRRIADRLKLFEYGTPEEFYDYKSDPDALNNLINDPAYSDAIKKHRIAMTRFMRESNDHALEAFESRDNPLLVSAYVDRKQTEANRRRKAEKKSRK